MSKRRRQPPRRSPRKPKYNYKNFAISDTDSDEDSVEYLGTWKNDKRTRQQKRGRPTKNLNLRSTLTKIQSAPPRAKRQTKNISNRRNLVTIGLQTDSCTICAHTSKLPEKLKTTGVGKNIECNEDESKYHPSTCLPATIETVSTPRELIPENAQPPSDSGTNAVSKVSLIDPTNTSTKTIFDVTSNESLDQSDHAEPEENDTILSMSDHIVQAAETGDGVHNDFLNIPFPLNELYSIDEDDENNTEDE